MGKKRFSKVDLSVTSMLKRTVRKRQSIMATYGANVQKQLKEAQSALKRTKSALELADALLFRYVPGMSPSIEIYCDRFVKATGGQSAIIEGVEENIIPKRRKR